MKTKTYANSLKTFLLKFATNEKMCFFLKDMSVEQLRDENTREKAIKKVHAEILWSKKYTPEKIYKILLKAKNFSEMQAYYNFEEIPLKEGFAILSDALASKETFRNATRDKNSFSFTDVDGNDLSFVVTKES